METLFGNNYFIIYLIACIAVISYTNFSENQRMFLLYLFTFSTAYFNIFPIITSIILLLISTFVFLEYLTEDTKKLELFTRLSHKFCDYIFMMFFQYHVLWVIIAFLCLYISRDNASLTELSSHISYAILHLNFKNEILLTIQITVLEKIDRVSRYLTIILSFVFLWLGSHRAISQPFKIKSITDISKEFENYPIYKFEYREEMQDKFNLLCAFEDRTYFQRKNSYSCVSLEYIKCFLINHRVTDLKYFSATVKSRFETGAALRFFKRGHSTPEMQLLRTLGIARGYDKYKIQRKFFEIIYSKIFFSSLREYHKANTYSNLNHYRHYLLYVYFQTVLTKVDGKTCKPLSSAFTNSNDISNWSMHGLFIACLGLSFRRVNSSNLSLFADVLDSYNLDPSKIIKLSKQFHRGKKFPIGDSFE